MSIENPFDKLSNFIDNAVEKQQIPGAVVSIVTPVDTRYVYHSGYAHTKKQIPVNSNTIYDLASLTKVVATLPAILQLLENGELDLDDPVDYYLPQFKKHAADITIKHLLTHSSGYQSGIRFHELGCSFNEAVEIISNVPDRSQPDTEVIYNDLNFITLASIVEKITNLPLDQYTREKIYQPLGMVKTTFNPDATDITRFAATEFREALNDYQWGTVHDENAFYFGGVCGHAGLFSTIHDLSLYCRMILSGGCLNNTKILSEKTIQTSVANHTMHLNKGRGLGWQLFDSPTIAGQYMLDGFGHTGFTGTSMWFSADRSYAVIILTNRVHFGRDISINRFRRIVHNLASLALVEN